MYDYKGWHFPDLDSHFKDSVDEWPETNYQQNALEAALKYVKNFNTAIDVGANIGLQSVRLAKKFTNVHSFEPTSINYECLTLNCKQLQNIQLYKIGLGESFGNEKISLPSNSKNCGAFSIIDFAGYEEQLIVEDISIQTLDSFNLRPNFIKIDTQGFEIAILKGAHRTLESKPVLLLECEKKKDKQFLIEYLKKYNYSLAETVRKDTIWIAE